jgi:hypothetical protein
MPVGTDGNQTVARKRTSLSFRSLSAGTGSAVCTSGWRRLSGRKSHLRKRCAFVRLKWSGRLELEKWRNGRVSGQSPGNRDCYSGDDPVRAIPWSTTPRQIRVLAGGDDWRAPCCGRRHFGSVADRIARAGFGIERSSWRRVVSVIALSRKARPFSEMPIGSRSKSQRR